MVKPSLKKQPISERGTILKPRLHWRSFPPHTLDHSGKSLGNPVVEVATPNGTINLTEGTNKNKLRV